MTEEEKQFLVNSVLKDLNALPMDRRGDTGIFILTGLDGKLYYVTFRWLGKWEVRNAVEWTGGKPRWEDHQL